MAIDPTQDPVPGEPAATGETACADCPLRPLGLFIDQTPEESELVRSLKRKELRLGAVEALIHEGQTDAPQSVTHKSLSTLAMEHQVCKKPGDQEEGCHPKDVQYVEHHREDSTGAAIGHQPGLLGAFEEGHRGVKENPEQ